MEYQKIKFLKEGDIINVDVTALKMDGTEIQAECILWVMFQRKQKNWSRLPMRL